VQLLTRQPEPGCGCTVQLLLMYNRSVSQVACALHCSGRSLLSKGFEGCMWGATRATTEESEFQCLQHDSYAAGISCVRPPSCCWHIGTYKHKATGMAKATVDHVLDLGMQACFETQ
jgi:hypothetical protein